MLVVVAAVAVEKVVLFPATVSNVNGGAPAEVPETVPQVITPAALV